MHDESLQSAILDAALDPSAWDAAFAQIAELVPGRRMHVIGFNVDKMTPSGGFGLNYEESFLDSYIQHYRFISPYTEVLARIPSGVVTQNQVGLDRDAFLKSEYYHDWIKPQENIRLGGGAIIDNARGSLLYIGADVPYRLGEEAEARWLSGLGRILPLLRHALHVNEQLQAGADSNRVGRSEADGGAFMALGKNGRLVASNRAAEQMLEAGDLIAMDATGVVRLRPQMHFRHTLSEILTSDLRLPRQFKLVTGAGRWTLTAQRLMPSNLMRSIETVTRYNHPGDVAVILSKDVEEVPIQTYLRAAPLRLTDSEIDIVLLFSDGYDPETIAEMREVRRITVSNQLKSAATKLGVNGQVGIVVAINRLRKMLGDG